MPYDMLQSLAGVSQYLVHTELHHVYFPYPLLICYHAARTSLVYQSNVRKRFTYYRMPWGAYVAGFLIMAWGGSVTTHFLLSIPPPPLYSIHPWINYISVHLFLTLCLEGLPSLLQPAVMDVIFSLPDAIIRAVSIVASLSILSNHSSISPVLKNSILTHIIVGATTSGGGGVWAGTLGVWDLDWRLSTPTPLRGGLINALDLCGGAIAAVIYGTLTLSHPGYMPLYEYLAYSLGLPASPLKEPFLTEPEAKAAITLVLTSLFLWKAVATHWRDFGVSQEKKSQ